MEISNLSSNIELQKAKEYTKEEIGYILSLLQDLLGKEVEYESITDEKYIKLGKQVNKVLTSIESKYNGAYKCVTFNYSPFSPKVKDSISWQIYMWELFMEGGKFTKDKFKKQFIALAKARQCGFSYMMTRLITAICLNFDDTNIILGTGDKTWIKSIFEPYFYQVLPVLEAQRTELNKADSIARKFDYPLPGKFRYDKQRGIIYFPNGSKIYLTGSDTIADRIRGVSNIYLIVFDESAYIKNSDNLINILQPTQLWSEGSQIFGSSPKDLGGWFGEYFKPDYQGIAQTVTVDSFHTSLFSYQEVIDNMCHFFYLTKEQKPWLDDMGVISLYAQEYMCYFPPNASTDMWFPNFKKDYHVFDHDKFMELWFTGKIGLTWYFIIDYGGAADFMASLLVAIDDDTGQMYVVEEFKQKCGVSELADWIKLTETKIQVKASGYIADRSIYNKSVTISKTEHIRIADTFVRFGIDVSKVQNNMKKQLRLDKVNASFELTSDLSDPLKTQEEGCMLYLSSGVTKLQKEMTLERKADTSFNRSNNDDLIDCLLYGTSDLLYNKINNTPKVDITKLLTKYGY